MIQFHLHHISPLRGLCFKQSLSAFIPAKFSLAFSYFPSQSAFLHWRKSWHHSGIWGTLQSTAMVSEGKALMNMGTFFSSHSLTISPSFLPSSLPASKLVCHLEGPRKFLSAHWEASEINEVLVPARGRADTRTQDSATLPIMLPVRLLIVNLISLSTWILAFLVVPSLCFCFFLL